MTDWFARPVLHVTNVEASLRFYVNQLGLTSPWRSEEDGRAYVAQVERQGAARGTRGQGRFGQGWFVGLPTAGGR